MYYKYVFHLYNTVKTSATGGVTTGQICIQNKRKKTYQIGVLRRVRRLVSALLRFGSDNSPMTSRGTLSYKYHKCHINDLMFMSYFKMYLCPCKTSDTTEQKDNKLATQYINCMLNDCRPPIPNKTTHTDLLANYTSQVNSTKHNQCF